MIALIDYGSSNLKSVYNALTFLGKEDIKITDSTSDINDADAVILPGVGSFDKAMESLKSLNLVSAICDYIKEDRPFLGICLGLQLLFNSSEEATSEKGLSCFGGNVLKFKQDEARKYKIPHMGWNSVKFNKESRLFHGIEENSYFYFVHSYYLKSADNEIVATKTDYCDIAFDSAIEKGNVCATQFHIEKSGDIGIKVLKNFLSFIK